MGFTRRIDIDLPYDQAVTATKAALQERGFGALTEIDLRETLKDKLGVDTDPQVIIGARPRDVDAHTRSGTHSRGGVMVDIAPPVSPGTTG